MYLCSSCLAEHYYNAESLVKTEQRCELCRFTTDCTHIPDNFLQPRVSYLKDAQGNFVVDGKGKRIRGPQLDQMGLPIRDANGRLIY